MFDKPNPRPNFSELEDQVTNWWKEKEVYEQSLVLRDGAPDYIFYDGPPFMSGMPHYATLLSSLPKDVIPRYKTMKGMRVERLWGWDCHGLPIENKVEDQLEIKGRKQILEYGLEKFIEKCYEWNRVGIENWRWYIDKIGRWADLDNAYRTLDQDYMETVWWSFKQMWERGLVYKGKRTSLFSTDSSTPVSDFEVSMDPDNYKDTEDTAVTIKFKLTEESKQKLSLTEKDSYLVAWTTTPWTLPSNFALAVNAEAEYVAIEVENEILIFAKARLEYVLDGKEYKIVKELKATDLEGLDYEQLYNFLQGGENDFKVYLSEYVTTEDGSGVLHVAPAFGEADFDMGTKWNLSFTPDIDDAGKLTVGPWNGVYIRKANDLITEDLRVNNKLFKSEKYIHRLPYYRYKNPLIYKVQESYFVSIQKIKAKLLESNEQINWIPEHFKDGRFKYILESAPDWSVSRSRFWGTAMPIWQNEEGKQIVVGSRDELMELVNNGSKNEKMQKVILSLNENDSEESEHHIKEVEKFIDSKNEILEIKANQKTLSLLRNKFLGETEKEASVKAVKLNENRAYYLINGKALDLHRPYIDDIKFEIEGKEYQRIPETLDVWMDSGSMPFAQFHYPFKNKEEFEKNKFPGDFIAEYTGQIRAWFYVLHVIANALFDKPAFKNVLVTGVLAGNDGRKMSKSFGNYPDPKATLEKYGGDALRLYFLGSPIMLGEDMNFNEEELKLQTREVLLPLWNIYTFLTSYANMHGWKPSDELVKNERNINSDSHPWMHIPFDDLENNLDAWIITKLQLTIKVVTENLDAYKLPKALDAVKELISEISKWYIRENRDRFAKNDPMALDVLYYVLIETLKLSAPFIPFLTENLYQELVGKHVLDAQSSIHLTDYPVADEKFIEEYKEILPEMEIVRKISDMGQTLRVEKGLKVRQPLSELQVASFNKEVIEISPWMQEILMNELNVRLVSNKMDIKADEKIAVAEDKTISIKIGLNTEISEELKNEGVVRELIRQIQAARKKKGLNIGDKINVHYSTSDSLKAVIERYKDQLKAGVSADLIEEKNEFADGMTVQVNNEELNIEIAKI